MAAALRTYILAIKINGKYKRHKPNRLAFHKKESHTCMIVREWWKGDDAMGKPEIFDPSPRSNPLTDRHQKLHTWLGPGCLPTCKI